MDLAATSDEAQLGTAAQAGSPGRDWRTSVVKSPGCSLDPQAENKLPFPPEPEPGTGRKRRAWLGRAG